MTDFENRKAGEGATGEPEGPPAYLEFKQRLERKPASLLRTFFLVGFLLVAVILLSSLIQLVEEKERRGVLVDDVEIPEFAPPPELPEPLYTETVEEEVPELRMDPARPGESGIISRETLDRLSEETLRELSFTRDPAEIGRLIREDSSGIALPGEAGDAVGEQSR